MKISIITITYNSEDTIRDTIDSVLSQSYTDIEHVIVDGQSTDKTMDIIRSYGDKIHKVISEPDKGLYDALNKGIRNASGDVVGFMHSDDVFASNSVVKTITEVFENFGVDSMYGDLIYVNKNDTNKLVRLWRAGKFKTRKMLFGWMPPHPTFYVKRELYLKYGGFDLSYRISADYENMLRFLFRNKISTFYLPMFIVKMRLGGESNRSLSNILKKSLEDMKAIKKNGLLLQLIPALLNKNLSKVKQYFIPDWIIRALSVE